MILISVSLAKYNLICNIILHDWHASRYPLLISDELKQSLDDYVANLPKVSVLRLPKRQGLIRARLEGAKVSKGRVLTFLDAHCECTLGWVEPLLTRIKESKSNVVMPVIDEISETDFHYNAVPEPFQRGVFRWRLEFTWRPIPQYEEDRRRNEADGIRYSSYCFCYQDFHIYLIGLNWIDWLLYIQISLQ